MIPEFPVFKNIEISDQQTIELLVSQYAPYSDFSFVALFCWDVDQKRKIAMLNNNLVMHLTDDGTGEDFLSFLGENKIFDTADILTKYARRVGLKPKLKLITEESVKATPELESLFEVVPDTDNFDYVYSVSDMAQMHGPKYAAVRNSLNKFLKNFADDCETKVLDLRQEQSKKYLYEIWKEWNGISEDYSEREVYAIKSLLMHVDDFKNLLCIMVFISGKPVGFSINQLTHHGYAISHFAKVNYEYPGIFPFLWKETAKYLESNGCKYVNLEEDMGLPGLRRAKSLYRPAFFLEQYTLNRKESFAQKTLRMLYSR